MLKVFATIFVVFIHSYTTAVTFADGGLLVAQPAWLMNFEFAISQVVSRCGVPIFFLISSILLYRKSRDYLPMLKQKVITMLFPYLLWNSFWIVVIYIFQSIPQTKAFFSGFQVSITNASLTDLLQLYGFGQTMPLDYPLWFLRDLMIVTLFYPVIAYLTKRAPKSLLIGSLLLIVFPVDFFLKAALSWTLVGACAVELQLRMANVDSLPMPIVFGSYVSLAAVIVFLNYKGVSLASLVSILNILGILFWVKVTKYLFSDKRLTDMLVRFASWSFIIYVSHELTLTGIKKICYKVMPNDPHIALLLYLLIPIFVITLSVGAGKLTKRFAPKFYGVITGGRA